MCDEEGFKLLLGWLTKDGFRFAPIAPHKMDIKTSLTYILGWCLIRLSTCQHPYRDYRYAHEDWCSLVLEAACGRSRSSVLLVMFAVTFLHWSKFLPASILHAHEYSGWRPNLLYSSDHQNSLNSVDLLLSTSLFWSSGLSPLWFTKPTRNLRIQTPAQIWIQKFNHTPIQKTFVLQFYQAGALWASSHWFGLCSRNKKSSTLASTYLTSVHWTEVESVTLSIAPFQKSQPWHQTASFRAFMPLSMSSSDWLTRHWHIKPQMLIPAKVYRELFTCDSAKVWLRPVLLCGRIGSWWVWRLLEVKNGETRTCMVCLPHYMWRFLWDFVWFGLDEY